MKKFYAIYPYLALLAALFLWRLVAWINWQFGENIDFDLLFFHLLAPWDGVYPGMFKAAIRLCVFPPLLLTLVAFLLTYVFSKRKYLKYYWRVATVLLLLSLAYVYVALGIHSHLFTQYSTFFEEHYVDARTLNFTYPAKSKNLLFIFMESLESTYENEQVFGDNLLPTITALGAHNASLQGYCKTYNTHWTFAALVSALCGVPVQTESASYTKAASLADVLKPADYNLAAMYGGKRRFAWTDNFLNAHGFDHIWAMEDIEAQYAGYKELSVQYWGLSDISLYLAAQDKLAWLHEQGKPFAMFINTIDTHPPGYLDPACPVKYNDMRDTVACADYMLQNFMIWAKAQPWYENTVIILIGDHLAMQNDLSSKYLLPNADKRDLVNVIINAPCKGVYKRAYAMFDMLPTVVEVMGIGVPGHRLGLGVSLLSREPTLLEHYGWLELDRQLRSRSQLYDSFNR